MTILIFPTQDRGVQRPAAQPSIVIVRLTLVEATDWQETIMAECRRQRSLTMALPAFLKQERLMDRCTFLSSDGPGEPLRFRHLGVPTLSVLGRAWGRSVLNQPDEADPHVEFANSVGAQYAESIGAGEPLFNRVAVAGLGRPFAYTHALYGWEERGRRAVLSAVDVCTVH